MRVLKNFPDLKILKEENKSLKAVFWDMDGTLLNTEPLHASSLLHTLKQLKCRTAMNSQDILKKFAGETDHVVYDYYISNSELDKSVSWETFIELKNLNLSKLIDTIESEKILSPKIRDFINSCSKENIQLAIVTSSEKVIANKLLSKLNINSHFKLVITREDTLLNKPNPEPYLKASNELNLNLSDIVIFEDSLAGLTAAQKSKIPFYKAHWY